MKDLLLYSAGLDSTLILHAMLEQDREVECFICDYGQTSILEIHRAKAFCIKNNISFHIQKFEMLDSDNRGEVFARNLLFCSKALEYACHNGHHNIVIGSCADDVYTDSSEDFITHFNRICLLFGKQLVAPIKHLNKTEILKRCLDLGVDFKYVYSCREDHICFKCKTCTQLLESFEQLGYDNATAKGIIAGVISYNATAK